MVKGCMSRRELPREIRARLLSPVDMTVFPPMLMPGAALFHSDEPDSFISTVPLTSRNRARISCANAAGAQARNKKQIHKFFMPNLIMK
jgi:hypothetical protein